MRRRHPLTRITALALALGAFTAPAAVAQQDLRSPDARDAAAAATVKQDLRSPDTRDAAHGVFAPRHFVLAPAPHAQQSPSGSHQVAPTGVSLLVLVALGGAFALLFLVRRRSGTLVTAMADGTRDWRRGVGL